MFLHEPFDLSFKCDLGLNLSLFLLCGHGRKGLVLLLSFRTSFAGPGTFRLTASVKHRLEDFSRIVFRLVQLLPHGFKIELICGFFTFR